MKRSEKILVLLAFLVSIVMFSIVAINAGLILTGNAQPSPYIDLDLGSTFDYVGGWLNLTVHTNYPSVNVTLTNGETTHVFKNKPDGWSRNISLDGADSGYYKIIANAGDYVNTRVFTVVNNDNWKDADFPLEGNHKGVYYTLYPNGTLQAKKHNDVMTLDLGWLKALANQEGTSKTIEYNNMNLRGSWFNPSGFVCNITFIKVYEGLKMIVYIKSPNAIVFEYHIKQGQSVIEGFRQGSLGFNYGDLLKQFKQFTTVDNKKVTLTLSSGEYYIDPTFFESFFETGDISEWDGKVESLGGIVDIQDSFLIQGNYTFKGNDTSFGGGAMVYEAFPSDTYYYVNVTMDVNFESLPDDYLGAYDRLVYLISRNTVTPFYRDMFRWQVTYNSTLGYPEWSLRYNYTTGTPEYYSGVEVEENVTYRVTFLSNYTSREHYLYVDGVMLFNLTGQLNDTGMCHDYWKVGLADSAKDDGETLTVYFDNFRITQDAWVFRSMLYFHVYEFKGYPIEAVNVTLYNSTFNYQDSSLTDSTGLAQFNHTYTTQVLGVVMASNEIVSRYDSFTIVQNTNNNITKYVQAFTGGSGFSLGGSIILGLIILVLLAIIWIYR